MIIKIIQHLIINAILIAIAIVFPPAIIGLGIYWILLIFHWIIGSKDDDFPAEDGKVF